MPAREPAIRVILLPRDTNEAGTIFGGVILSQLDLAGAVEARRHTAHRTVTVALKEVVFQAPVYVGDQVSFYAETTKVGRTSIHVHVDVLARRRKDPSAEVPVTEADLVYVAIDDHGRPTPVKP